MVVCANVKNELGGWWSRRLRAGAAEVSVDSSGSAWCYFAVLGDIDGALSSLLERGLHKLFARRVARATLGVECILAELHELFWIFAPFLHSGTLCVLFAIHVGADILQPFLMFASFTRAFLTFSQQRRCYVRSWRP